MEKIQMAKWANTSVLDTLLDKVATGNQIIVTTSQPADRTAALAASLASTTLIPGDFTKAAGSPSGRQVTVAQKANISVSASGTATHVCIVDGTNLLYVTTVTSQALTSGNTVTIPAWKITVTNPS
jgi:hypothetical protein